MHWQNGWAVVNAKFRYKVKVQAPALPLFPFLEEPTTDEFDSSHLALKWNMLAYPLSDWYNLTERKGFLRLKGTKDALKETNQVAFVGRRQKEMGGVCQKEVEFKPEAENEEAGLSVFQSGRFNYSLFVTMRKGKKSIVLRKTVGDMITETVPISLKDT